LRHELRIDLRLDLYHRGLGTLNGYLVQSCHRAFCLLDAAYLEHRAGLYVESVVGYILEESFHTIASGRREESQMSEVDGCNGYGAVAQAVYSLKQRSVASAAEHKRGIGLLASAIGVYFCRIHTLAGDLLYDLGKLLIYCIIEAVMPDKLHELLHLCGSFGNLWAGKKYNFHLILEKNK
jgi:hypothetical protein